MISTDPKIRFLALCSQFLLFFFFSLQEFPFYEIKQSLPLDTLEVFSQYLLSAFSKCVLEAQNLGDCRRIEVPKEGRVFAGLEKIEVLVEGAP